MEVLFFAFYTYLYMLSNPLRVKASDHFFIQSSQCLSGYQITPNSINNQQITDPQRAFLMWKWFFLSCSEVICHNGHCKAGFSETVGEDHHLLVKTKPFLHIGMVLFDFSLLANKINVDLTRSGSRLNCLLQIWTSSIVMFKQTQLITCGKAVYF